MKACSFYSTHWVAKSTCLLVCNGKPLLIKENNQRAYSYLELRCRKPARATGEEHQGIGKGPSEGRNSLDASLSCP